MIDHVLHVLVGIAFPPLLLGVIARVKAWFAGRIGPPLLQPYFDLLKLWQKGSVISSTTTWVFQAGPVVGLATAAVALLIVPLGGQTTPVSFAGDLVLVAYLFALGRFFTASAALDTGSAFEGMGAAREVTFACLAEPAFFLSLMVLVKLSGSLQLDVMLGSALADEWATAGAPLALVLVSWFVILLAETCRVPFDDPNTHLELTMIHEVMVLDHSGPAFGMILYGAALKLFAFSALLVRLAIPQTAGLPWPLYWPAFLAGVLAVAVVVGVVESIMARLRLTHVPTMLLAANLLAAFGVVLLAR